MPITTYDYLLDLNPTDDELASVEVPSLDGWDDYDEDDE